MNHIEKKMKDIVSEYTDENVSLESTSQTLDEMGIDSLSLVEIIFDIEEAFDIKIPDDTVLKKQGYSLNGYADILAMVETLVKERQKNV